MILPGGLQRLRVIEAKYQDLITYALKLNKNFIIAYDTNGQNNPYQWGVYAQIVNFDLTVNGFLLVDIKALSVVTLADFRKSESGTWSADAQYVSHWTMINKRTNTKKFSDILRKLFRTYPQISVLYSETYFDSIEWVCARLIELLPIADGVKKTFLKPDSFQLVVSFLETIIDENYDHGDLNGG